MKNQPKKQKSYMFLSTSIYDVQQQFQLIDLYEKVKNNNHKKDE